MPDKPLTFEPDARYRITVNRVINVDGMSGIWFRPSSPNIVVRGDYAATIADAIVTAEKLGVIPT